ncbi:ylp motif containing protein nuclear protein zap [Anaeramoeba flamelloides]|uniref:Ylp motif containing protein nuclear protein zap n=1 Tax=Anaeramoeba flamelloides TaxID=1746091 RepID=A0AAV7ZQP2_9EUKA|nr:ylp motif containing protein nuclear protein zap [Anaeramoeba flamelloides]
MNEVMNELFNDTHTCDVLFYFPKTSECLWAHKLLITTISPKWRNQIYPKDWKEDLVSQLRKTQQKKNKKKKKKKKKKQNKTNKQGSPTPFYFQKHKPQNSQNMQNKYQGGSDKNRNKKHHFQNKHFNNPNKKKNTSNKFAKGRYSSQIIEPTFVYQAKKTNPFIPKYFSDQNFPKINRQGESGNDNSKKPKTVVRNDKKIEIEIEKEAENLTSTKSHNEEGMSKSQNQNNYEFTLLQNRNIIIIEITDYKLPLFRNVIKYAYTKEIPELTENNIFEYIQICSEFQITELEPIFLKYLSGLVTIENCISMFFKIENTNFHKYLVRFIKRNLVEFFSHPSRLIDCTEEIILKILKNHVNQKIDHLSINIFRCVYEWGKTQFENDSRCIGNDSVDDNDLVNNIKDRGEIGNTNDNESKEQEKLKKILMNILPLIRLDLMNSEELNEISLTGLFDLNKIFDIAFYQNKQKTQKPETNKKKVTKKPNRRGRAKYSQKKGYKKGKRNKSKFLKNKEKRMRNKKERNRYKKQLKRKTTKGNEKIASYANKGNQMVNSQESELKHATDHSTLNASTEQCDHDDIPFSGNEIEIEQSVFGTDIETNNQFEKNSFAISDYYIKTETIEPQYNFEFSSTSEEENNENGNICNDQQTQHDDGHTNSSNTNGNNNTDGNNNNHNRNNSQRIRMSIEQLEKEVEHINQNVGFKKNSKFFKKGNLKKKMYHNHKENKKPVNENQQVNRDQDQDQDQGQNQNRNENENENENLEPNKENGLYKEQSNQQIFQKQNPKRKNKKKNQKNKKNKNLNTHTNNKGNDKHNKGNNKHNKGNNKHNNNNDKQNNTTNRKNRKSNRKNNRKNNTRRRKSQGGHNSCTALLICADNDGKHLEDLKNSFQNSAIKKIESVIVTSKTPTISFLKKFSVIFIYSLNKFHNSSLLGDRLAKFVDSGGGIVIAAYPALLLENEDGNGNGNDNDDDDNDNVDRDGDGNVSNCNEMPQSEILNGRITQKSFLPILQGSILKKSMLKIGNRCFPKHPILKNVKGFNGGNSSLHCNLKVNPEGNSQIIAEWEDSTPLIAIKKKNPKAGNVVVLNFCPLSSNVGASNFWLNSTDGNKILSNALLFASKK